MVNNSEDHHLISLQKKNCHQNSITQNGLKTPPWLDVWLKKQVILVILSQYQAVSKPRSHPESLQKLRR